MNAMTSTITSEQEHAIAVYLKDRHITAGLGTADEACSIAAINLALFGKLTDNVPDCMSFIIGRWIIVIQDAMPDKMRNSIEWRRLLPLAAGTGRDHETARLRILINWVWEKVLPPLQTIADDGGFGEAWRAIWIAADAARATDRAALTADRAAEAAEAAARAAEAAAEAAEAAEAALATDQISAWATTWAQMSPATVLAQLIAVSVDVP
jgi:hypothetical protein